MPFGSHSLKVGDEAPLLTLSSPQKAGSLDSTKGKYVIVNFWSPTDPISRINNKRLADLTDSLPSSQVKFVSICTDNDTSLETEITKADGISENAILLSANDISPEVFDDYQTSTGCRSFLIDPFGNLKAISPSHAEITRIAV